MANQAETAKKFFQNPDRDSRAKSRFAYYYFGLYLKIIDNIRSQYARNKQIVYLDLFAGDGRYGTGEESVPLKVLGSAYRIENIRFHFNDYYRASALEENIKKRFGYDVLPDKIKVTNEDATTMHINSLFGPNDIVISYIDSFSYLLCDTKTINKLIKNAFSDAVIYLNVEHFYRFIDNEAEQESFSKFFGSKDRLEHFRRRYKETINKDEVTLEIVEDFIKRLNQEHGSRLSYLPVFFRKSESNTVICQVLMVISKNDTGPKRVRERFTELPKEIDDKGKFNRDFYFEDGRMTVYVDSSRNQLCLFDDDFEKYSKILNFMGNSPEEAINLSTLLCRIDDKCVRKHGYLSGYTEAFLRRELTYFEDKGMIGIISESSRKRPLHTWGPKTKFYKLTGTSK